MCSEAPGCAQTINRCTAVLLEDVLCVKACQLRHECCTWASSEPVRRRVECQVPIAQSHRM